MFLKKNRDRIEGKFDELCREFPAVMEDVRRYIEKLPPKEALALSYLYDTMPLSDIANYPPSVFETYVTHSVWLWENLPRVQELPEEVFLNYVLYHRTNDEEILDCRRPFYDSFLSYLKEEGKTQPEEWIFTAPSSEVAQEMNFWCAHEASYQASDMRTRAARTVFACGEGRCGEESVFTVNALRCVGIPARQVYAPRWSHCDDNHAWVEFYVDGDWHYYGACEPAPILDRGWFCAASSRAMMIHARWFDSILPEDEEYTGRTDMPFSFNQLHRYADTVTVRVKVLDESGAPVPDCKVEFQVLNYSELFPVATVMTDAEGMAQLETGLGGIHIDVCGPELLRAEAQLDTRSEQDVTCVLSAELPPQEIWTDFDAFAPAGRGTPRTEMTPEKKAAFDEKLARVNAARIQKVKNFRNPEIEAFLEKGDRRELREKLLETLAKKDSCDLKSAVLEAHFQAALPYEEEWPEELFVSCVMNPRIAHEILTDYRGAIQKAFSADEQQRFREKPAEIQSWILENIQTEPLRDRSTLIAAPAAALRMGVAGETAKKVLFVAIARSLGIPARLNPESGQPEYWGGDSFCCVTEKEHTTAGLTASVEGDPAVWNYFKNWTVARLENGRYHTYSFPEDIAGKRMALPEGVYRLITANRLPNGNLFAQRYDFTLAEGEEKQVTLSMREAALSDMVSRTPLPAFSVKTADGEEKSGAELAAGRRSAFLWLEPGAEPTEHIQNELIERAGALGELSDRIYLILREGGSGDGLKPELLKIPGLSICHQEFGAQAELLARSLFTEPGSFPLYYVAEPDEEGGGLTALYGTSGYQVGAVDLLLRFLRMPS